MKAIKIIVCIFFLFPLNLVTQEETLEQLIVNLSNPEQPGILTVEHIKGSINVTGYDGEVIIVNASLRGGIEGNGESDAYHGLRKITTQEIQLSAREDNNEVTVTSSVPGKTVDLTVTVPYKTSLKLKTYHNGEITVNNVRGEMEISNLNGNITLNEVSGSTMLNTVDGDIFVKFKEVTPETPMAFTTIYGKIDVTIPADVRALVKMKSDHGEIFSDFDMEKIKTSRELKKKRDEGVSETFLEEWTSGKINGGGPEFLFKSFEGNIYIRKRM